ncbi:MAG: prolyl oligopeptidase family serine peptidase [Acidobacteriota bacterium]
MKYQKILSISLMFTIFLVSISVFATQPFIQAQSSRFTVDDLLDVTNINVADFSEDGKWIVATASTLRDRIGIDNHRFGDPTYIAPALADILLIETQTGKTQKLFPTRRQVRALRWSPDASRLAMLLLEGELFKPVVWERATGKLNSITLPPNKLVAENTELEWSADSSQLLLSLRSADWKKRASDRFKSLTAAPIVTLSSKDPFLAWEELRRMANLRSLAICDVKSNQVREVVAESRINAFDFSEDSTFITYSEDITKKTDYDTIGGVDNQVQLISAQGGAARTLIKSTKGLNIIWSRDTRSYAYTKDGNIFIAKIDDKEARQLTGKKDEKSDTKDDADKKDESKTDDKAKSGKETFNAVRLSARGEALVASNKEGLWLIDTTTGAKENFLKQNEEDKEAPRYQVSDWSADGENIYLSYASRTRWERGFMRYNTRAKQMSELIKDGRMYAGFRLAKNGSATAFNIAEGNRPADIFVADGDCRNLRRLTDVNPQLSNKRLSKTQLFSYLDADGTKSYGVVYLPVDYEPGKKYPTVFNIYEQFFDDTFNSTINILTNNGYAVVQPSVNLEQGFPGEAWAKGVTAAANKLIEMGIADPERLGVQGTSYGGYATNLLITQTNRFKAAINISGKVNMISFYTDSPRLGDRNTHAPEKSQDRIGATLWQQPQKYIQHSAVMFADRIKTPLLLMTGEQDHNVPARQAMEMYYALRRLGKAVEWVSYTNGGHGMPTTTIDEVKDYHARITKWYDDHLKGDLKKKTEDKTDAGQQ